MIHIINFLLAQVLAKKNLLFLKKLKNFLNYAVSTKILKENFKTKTFPFNKTLLILSLFSFLFLFLVRNVLWKVQGKIIILWKNKLKKWLKIGIELLSVARQIIKLFNLFCVFFLFKENFRKILKSSNLKIYFIELYFNILLYFESSIQR